MEGDYDSIDEYVDNYGMTPNLYDNHIQDITPEEEFWAPIDNIGFKMFHMFKFKTIPVNIYYSLFEQLK